jgi:hypothetical protein
MKYEKLDKNGVAWIRITIDENNVVERLMVDADKALFDNGPVYVVEEKDLPPTEPIPDSKLEPVPAEPYPTGP